MDGEEPVHVPVRGRFPIHRRRVRLYIQSLVRAIELTVGLGLNRDGKYGLYLDSQMYNGISQKCPAFDNEVLVSDRDGKFECIGVEVWGVGD